MEIKIVKNAEFGSTEIYFNGKPTKEVRDALKGCGFRWHGVKKCWYGYADGESMRHMIEGAEGVEAVKAEKLPKGAESGENVKTPEPVEGVRDFARDIRKGDIVRISGATGSTGKSINGLYYVETVHGAGDYWLNSLKRDRGSDFEGIGKKSHSWPLRCYANSPKVRAEFRENIKDAKIEGMGPRSAAVYSLMLRNLDELRANRDKWSNYGGECYRQEQQKRADELAADLRRMREENPGLDQFAAKLDEKFKPTGPGLAIRADGLEVRSDCGTWDKYALSLRHEGDAVSIWGSYYGRGSSATIPAGFGFDVTNNSDSMTDYFEADSATVKQDHPLFETLVRIIDAGRGRYELTDSDAEAIAAYLKAKESAAEARREQEEAERAAKEEAKDQHAREVIAQYVELFPGDSYHPHVVVQWSELTAMAEHALEYAGELNDNGATVFSVEAWENITGELDAYFKDDLGYNKTKFEFIDPINDRHFIDRCDIGEGNGSYGTRARHTIKWCKEHASEQYYMKDGGACCSPEEGAQEAQMYLDCIPATFDDLNAMD